MEREMKNDLVLKPKVSSVEIPFRVSTMRRSTRTRAHGAPSRDEDLHQVNEEPVRKSSRTRGESAQEKNGKAAAEKSKEDPDEDFVEVEKPSRSSRAKGFEKEKKDMTKADEMEKPDEDFVETKRSSRARTAPEPKKISNGEDEDEKQSEEDRDEDFVEAKKPSRSSRAKEPEEQIKDVAKEDGNEEPDEDFVETKKSSRSKTLTKPNKGKKRASKEEAEDEDLVEAEKPSRSTRAKGPEKQKDATNANTLEERSEVLAEPSTSSRAKAAPEPKNVKKRTSKEKDEDEAYDPMEDEEDVEDAYEPEEDSDFEEPVRKKPKPTSSKRVKKPKLNVADAEDTEVIVDGQVRHGIQVGALKLTTSRPARGGHLNSIQRTRLFKLGGYLGFLKNIKQHSDEDTSHSGVRNFKTLPVHFLDACDKVKMGVLHQEWFRSHGHVEGLMKRELTNLRCINSLHAFDKRVTAIIWHPTAPYYGIIGDKWGNLKVWNTKEPEPMVQSVGEGAGDAIYGLKYDPLDGLGEDYPWRGLSRRLAAPDSINIYAAGVSGKVNKHRLCPSGMVDSDALYFTGEPHLVWLTCLDVEPDGKCVWAGTNKGNMIQIDTRVPKSAPRPTFRLHKTKISCVQAAPRNPWMLATGSLEPTVKIWDSRMLSERKEMYNLPHDKAVGSLAFSRMDGNRLLTTDQHSQLRVYSADNFALETTIAHPHRQFQHLTAIEAAWHPLCDLIAVGCYPDPNLPVRQGYKGDLEFFCARTGNLVCSIQDPSSTQIISLAQFNTDGSRLMINQGMSVKVYGFQPPYNPKMAPEDMPDDDDWKPRGGDGSDNDDDDDYGSKRKKPAKGKKPASKTPKGKNPNAKPRAPRGKKV